MTSEAWRTYNESIASAQETYEEAVTQTLKDREEAIGSARKAYMKAEARALNKTCREIDSCYKVNMILDKDYPSDGFYAGMIRKICAKCDDYKPMIEGGGLTAVEEVNTPRTKITKKELIQKLEDTNLKLATIQDAMDDLMDDVQTVFDDFTNTISPIINDYYSSEEKVNKNE